MFPRTAQQQWWFEEPASRNRSQAIGLRIAIAYHQRDPRQVESLMPQDRDETWLVMGALQNGLLALNQIYPPGSPDEVWERVTPIIDAAAPRGVAPRTRALLAAMSHAMYTATLGEVEQRKEEDPYTAVHLYAAITAMRAAEREDGVERMQARVDELDPRP